MDIDAKVLDPSERFGCGLVPISGDGITNGHVDIIQRAKAVCEEIVVLIAESGAKKGRYLFSADDKRRLAERAVRHAGITGARVLYDEGLAVDVGLREGCDVVFRGVRNPADLAYEEALTAWNAYLLPGLVVRYIPARKELEMVSSSSIKEIVSLGGDVSPFVPMFVKSELEERLLNRFSIAVTGRMAVGKSHVAKMLVRQAVAEGLPSTHVNIDDLVRELYDEDSRGAQRVRDKLGVLFGTEVLTPDRKRVDRSSLGAELFAGGAAAFAHAERITKPNVNRKYREAIKGAEGLVVLEWSQLAEMDMAHWTNGNVIIVSSEDRDRFREVRGIPPERIAAADRIQWHPDLTRATLFRGVERAGHGTIIPYENRFRAVPTTEAQPRAECSPEEAALFEQVLDALPGLRTFKKKTGP